MTIDYEVLHYRGDLTGSEDCQPGTLLGVNEMGWPFEVLDAEVVYGLEDSPMVPYTRVHLQTATVDAVRAAQRRVAAEQRERMLRMLPRHKRRQMQREGRL
jgi:hypothetical protein